VHATDILVVMETLLSSASVLFAGSTPTTLYRRIADASFQLSNVHFIYPAST